MDLRKGMVADEGGRRESSRDTSPGCRRGREEPVIEQMRGE